MVYLGICRKVKINFLKCGHTHCDNDGEIGHAGTAISNIALPTFEHFRKEIISCFENRQQSYVDVLRYC